MTPGIILTDIDETVLRCGDVLQHFIQDRYGLTIEGRLRDLYHIDREYGVGQEEHFRIIGDFHQSMLMRWLPPEKCAAEVLPRLYKAGWRFVAISAATDSPNIWVNRRLNLEDVFGFPWENVICTGERGKYSDLARYEPSVWVEDHFDNAKIGAEVGHRTFLLNRAYNTGEFHPRVQRVKDWHAIEGFLNEG